MAIRPAVAAHEHVRLIILRRIARRVSRPSSPPSQQHVRGHEPPQPRNLTLPAPARTITRCTGAPGVPPPWPKPRDANRPILLSIGYAACHWCHVMAHESFEDADTAALMNRLFVNIKVDREERPDIDHLYMSALHMLGEQGGWPLTMFLAPDGTPFWGGTYFPPEPRWGRPSFRQVLQGVSPPGPRRMTWSRRTVRRFARPCSAPRPPAAGELPGPAHLDRRRRRLSSAE